MKTPPSLAVDPSIGRTQQRIRQVSGRFPVIAEGRLTRPLHLDQAPKWKGTATCRRGPCWGSQQGIRLMEARLDHQNDRPAPAGDLQLSGELAIALKKVVAARGPLQAPKPPAGGHPGGLVAYLQAAVHHLAVPAVAQGQRTEQL